MSDEQIRNLVVLVQNHYGPNDRDHDLHVRCAEILTAAKEGGK